MNSHITCLFLLCLGLATFSLVPANAEDKPETADPKMKLTPLQEKVTKEDCTEPAFRNEYWDNHREGIYVCVISGEPLFSSHDKFDSGTGWPSFTKPLNPAAVIEKTDVSHGMQRTEVRSVKGESHLGHVFPDGPSPTNARYCMNSAAMRFVPVADLEKEGLGKYKELFVKPEVKPEPKAP